MYITWEDRKNTGSIDGVPLQKKPVFSFEYAWFLLTEDTALYVESHDDGYFNKPLTQEQINEVTTFYNNWEPPVAPEPTEEEVIQEFNLTASMEDSFISPTVMKRLMLVQIADVPDEDLQEYATLFPTFKIGAVVTAGDRYQYDGDVWEAIQPHTTQLDWLPPDVPALWKRVHDPAVLHEWVQPDSTDAYMIGNQVSFEGHIWVSTIDNNVWSPATYPEGWEDLGVA